MTEPHHMVLVSAWLPLQEGVAKAPPWGVAQASSLALENASSLRYFCDTLPRDGASSEPHRWAESRRLVTGGLVNRHNPPYDRWRI